MRCICRLMILSLVILSGITNLWGMEEEEGTPLHSVSSSISSDDIEGDMEDSHLFSFFPPTRYEKFTDDEYSLTSFGVPSSPESEEVSDESITIRGIKVSDPLDIPLCHKERPSQREYFILTSEEEELLSGHFRRIPDGDSDDQLSYINLINISVREIGTPKERIELIKYVDWLIKGRNKLTDCIDAVSGLLMTLPSERQIFFHQLVLLASWLPEGQALPGWIISKAAQIDPSLHGLFFRRLTTWLDKVDNSELFNIFSHLDEQLRFSGLNIALLFTQKWFEEKGAVFPADWVLSSLEKNLSSWIRTYKGLIILIPSFQRVTSQSDFEAARMLLSISRNPPLVANLAQDAAKQLEEKLDFQLLSFLAILAKIPEDHAYYQFILVEVLKNTHQSSDALYILNAFQGLALQKACDDLRFVGILKEVHEKLNKIEDPDQRFMRIKQTLMKELELSDA
ncbi:MAG: hypothetical protein K2P93_02685 [Alphaproteobacteria bacterium]|nr:hypothetical protein [Alphaproteobacteria bacterium]